MLDRAIPYFRKYILDAEFIGELVKVEVGYIPDKSIIAALPILTPRAFPDDSQSDPMKHLDDFDNSLFSRYLDLEFDLPDAYDERNLPPVIFMYSQHATTSMDESFSHWFEEPVTVIPAYIWEPVIQ